MHRLLTDNSTRGGIKPSNPFVRGKAPNLRIDITDYGYLYAGVRPLGDSEVHVRTYHFIMPFHQIRPSRSESGLPTDAGHIWVPIDDHHCMVYNWIYSTTDAPLTAEDRLERGLGNGPLHVDPKTFRSFQNRTNNYGLDREVQKTESYTGIDGINQQDRALQESMGRIVDRSREHLGPADKAIIQARKLLREAVKAVEAGKRRPAPAPAIIRSKPAKMSSRAMPTGTGRWRPTSPRTRSCRPCRAELTVGSAL